MTTEHVPSRAGFLDELRAALARFNQGDDERTAMIANHIRAFLLGWATRGKTRWTGSIVDLYPGVRTHHRYWMSSDRALRVVRGDGIQVLVGGKKDWDWPSEMDGDLEIELFWE